MARDRSAPADAQSRAASGTTVKGRWGAAWVSALLIALAAVAVHWNTLDCGYVNWDDRGYVAGNPLVTGEGGLRAIWFDVFREKPTKQYYPLTWTSFWIEYRLFGDSPRALHGTQIALHALTSVVVFFTLWRLGAPMPAALAAGLLFAVHPIHSASVAWIAERKNTLSGLFFFLSLLLYVEHVRRPGAWRYIGSLGGFLLALFAKTACVVLAPILLVTDRVVEGRWSFRSVRRAAPYFAIAMVMGVVTAHVESMHRKSGDPVELKYRPMVAAAAMVHYVRKIVLPVELTPIYPRWAVSISEPRYVVSVAFIIVAGCLLWKYRARVNACVTWGIAVFVISLLPVLGIVQFNYLQFSFVSDHFMYLPSVGLFLLVGLALHQISSWRAPAEATTPQMLRMTALVLPVVLLLSLQTVKQNRVWIGPVEFWEYTLERNPDCFPGHHNLGNHFMREGAYERALSHFLETVRIDPTYIIVHRSCARCCKELGREEEAVAHYRRAVAVERRKSPTSVGTQLEYADYLRVIGRMDEARRAYEAVLKVRPDHAAARRALNTLQRAGPSVPASE